MAEHSTPKQDKTGKDHVKQSPVVEDSDVASNQDVSKSERATPYRDFSRVPAVQTRDTSAVVGQGPSAKEPTFPVKLHMILSNPEFQDIISWLPHGRSWRILQQKAFEERVIPLYFRHGRYSSFARQVNGWGFRRITHGSDYNSYYHELFLRGLPHLCDRMRRLTSKDISQKKAMEEEAAPDFYALSREHPLPENNQAAPPKAKTKADAVPSTPPRSASPAVSASLTSQAPVAPAQPSADVELAMLERRRANILERMNALATARGLPGAAGLATSGLGLPDVSAYGGIPPLMGVSRLLGPSAELDLLRQRTAAADMNKYLGVHEMGLGGLGGLPPSTMLSRYRGF